ncbi:MAG: hypothetical protein WCT08_02480 [Patescibacteria group bacterium]|jgi:hypothetical protein
MATDLLKQKDVELIKECYPYNGRPKGTLLVIIRTSLQHGYLDYIFRLFKEAKKDFPKAKLTMEDVWVIKYDGDYVGTYGIEFYAKPSQIPAIYSRLRKGELPPRF